MSCNIRKQNICNRSADIVKKEKKKLGVKWKCVSDGEKGSEGMKFAGKKESDVSAWCVILCVQHIEILHPLTASQTFLTNSRLAVYFGQFKHLQDAFSVFFIASQIAKIYIFYRIYSVHISFNLSRVW